MSERFTIELSEEYAQMMREIAQLANQPIEIVIAELAQLSSSETIDTQLVHVNTFSTIRLWSTVHVGLMFPDFLNKRMSQLIQYSKQGNLSSAEQDELDDLIVLYDKYTLLRSYALVELQDRGYDIQTYLDENAPNP